MSVTERFGFAAASLHSFEYLIEVYPILNVHVKPLIDIYSIRHLCLINLICETYFRSNNRSVYDNSDLIIGAR